MSRFNGYIVCCSLLVLGFGCVATPRHAQDIEAARLAIRRVESMSPANDFAAREIADAHTALRYAETLARRHGAGSEISDAAHLATRHANIAAKQIELDEAKRIVEAAEREWQAREQTKQQLDDDEVSEFQNGEFPI